MALVFKDLSGEIVRLPDQLSNISVDYLEDIVTGNIDGYEVTITGQICNSSYNIDEATYTAIKNYLSGN